jgi:hypothetical protein
MDFTEVMEIKDGLIHAAASNGGRASSMRARLASAAPW